MCKPTGSLIHCLLACSQLGIALLVLQRYALWVKALTHRFIPPPRVPSSAQVLESFKIMDYSLLLGVHNMDQAERERQLEGSQGDGDEKKPVAQQKALYSTAMESIQGGAACGGSIDTDDT